MSLPQTQTKAMTIRANPSPRDFADRIAKWANFVTKEPDGNIIIAREVDDETRGEMILRGRELLAALRVTHKQAEHKRSGAAVAKMLALFTIGQNPENADKTVAGYVEAMADLPGWAVEEACARFIRGEVETQSPKHPPKPPEVRAETLRITGPLWAEWAKLRDIVRARVAAVLTDEQKSEMAQKLDALSSELHAKSDEPKQSAFPIEKIRANPDFDKIPNHPPEFYDRMEKAKRVGRVADDITRRQGNR